jgi:hypothetical protein
MEASCDDCESELRDGNAAHTRAPLEELQPACSTSLARDPFNGLFLRPARIRVGWRRQ